MTQDANQAPQQPAKDDPNTDVRILDRTVNQREPLLLTLGPLDRDLARMGLDFAVKTLDLKNDISSAHPLRSIAQIADQHRETGGIEWGRSREINQLGLWGLHLWMVQNWGGFGSLVERVKQDPITWDAHLHEASVAAMFSQVGCEGRFFNRNEQGPDLHVVGLDFESYVECRRSRSLTAEQRRDWPIWQAGTDRILPILRAKVPSAVVGIYPDREAKSGDGPTMQGGIEFAIDRYTKQSSPAKWVDYPTASDGSFTMTIVFAHESDALFDICAGQHLGIEIPGETEAVSCTVNLKLTKPPICTGLWLVKIARKHPWRDVEKAILDRLDKKASQLNRFWKAHPGESRCPNIVWIEHPAITSATNDEMLNLAARIRGKFSKNTSGHWDGVSSVVVSVSRMLLTKDGRLAKQQRIHFVSKEASGIATKVPYVTWEWWRDALDGRIPPKIVMGHEVRFARIPA